jgi:hypothetical protein
MPTSSDSTSNSLLENARRAPVFPPGMLRSIESQIKLRELYDYVETSRATLKELRMDLSLLESHPGCSTHIKSASDRLGGFCVDADSWGFNALYEIALSLQMLLLDCGWREQKNDFWEALNRGLTMLSALLEQCESDYRWRLAIADTLDCIKEAGRN